jgi:hypothetical protein
VPPDRDAVFRLNVLARLERVRFQRRMVQTISVGLAALMLVAINAQTIDTWMAADGRHEWIPGAAALVALLALLGMPTAAMPGMRVVVKAFGRWFSG